MPFPDPEIMLDQVEAVARAGAEALMPYWRALEPHEITEKARNDLVTVADRAAEAAILGEIESRFPDHAVLAEESGWTRRAEDRPTWIVDPLDGTTNFVHGIAQFAVSIGVAIGDRIELGVIIDPIKGDVFRAGRGLGVNWNGRPQSVTGRPSLDGALLATGFPFRKNELLDAYLAIFKEVFPRCKGIRRPGSAALDLAHTACGIFDGFFEFRLSPWDLAAGTLMVEEAGGIVTDMDGGPGYLTSGNIVCGARGVHADVLDVVRAKREMWAATR
ncbi:MAG: inositol monophosphatase family protein [Thermoanaerobaculales bacterium]|jgi:myo-inositol-1(or 4)-monophosphatase|nr:inositol monophosphatase family protein [Thermoanaerobaculales bacterium]